jgi:hypothetical protein
LPEFKLRIRITHSLGNALKGLDLLQFAAALTIDEPHAEKQLQRDQEQPAEGHPGGQLAHEKSTVLDLAIALVEDPGQAEQQ